MSADPAGLGRDLARRHQDSVVDVDETRTLLQVSESARAGDWTLRSSLMRFAQPHPALAGAVLESVRRSQASLDPLARRLMAHGTVTDRRLSFNDDGLAPVAEPCPDVRVADLARLVRLHPDGRAVIGGYEEITPLDECERQAVDLLVVALDLDEMAEELAAWSLVAPHDPPVERVELLARSTFERLAELGVARESAPPRRRG